MNDPADHVRATSPPAADAGQPSEAVTVLEQGLWRKLSAASTTAGAATAWAPLMASMLEGAEQVCVLAPDRDTQQLRQIASWPEQRAAGGTLISAAQEAFKSGRNIVRGDIDGERGDPKGRVAIAVPVIAANETSEVAAVELRARSRADLHLAMRRLQWGVAWLRDLSRDAFAKTEARRYEQAMHALNIVVAAAEQTDFPSAVRAAATDLAARFSCDRVSIGFRRFGRSRVVGISHSAQFGKEMNLVRLLAATMDEAIDQRGVVVFPDAGSDIPITTHRHEKFSQAHAVGHVLTVPLYAFDRFVGAVVFERAAQQPFSSEEAEILEAVVTVIAPVLDERRRNDRWLAVKAVDLLRRQIVRLLGPGYLARKLFVTVLLGLFAFFWFATGPDRVTADALVEGSVQRTVSAPFDGFIAEAKARAGDTVTEGDLVVRLDDRDLALERLRLVTELQRQRIEFTRALAQLNRSETSIRRSQIEQTEARISLIDTQMERSKIRAPYDGLVIAGDLSQAIGGAVVRGDALLTIAPVNTYRVVLKVDERRIADIVPGQTGQLLTTALPETPFPVKIQQITPVAEYGEGATTFRVEAELLEGFDALQPGMEGVAKVDIGEALLIDRMTRAMRDWARLRAWRWFGTG